MDDKQTGADAKFARRTANATGAIAFLTLAMVVIGILQWDSLRRTDDTTRKSLVDVQRAFVFSKGIGIARSNAPDGTVSVSFSVELENSGGTPTKDLYVFANWCCENLASPLPIDFTYPDFGNPRPVPILIGPKAETNTTLPNLSIDYLVLVQQKQRYAYFYGRAKYRDVFENSRNHTTRFCYMVANIDGDLRARAAGSPDRVKFTFTGCERHNCADEDCERQDLERKRSGLPPYPD